MSSPQRFFKPVTSRVNGGLGIDGGGESDRREQQNHHHQGPKQAHMPASSSYEYQIMSPVVSSPMSAVSPHHPTQSVTAASSSAGTSSRRASFVLDSPVGAFGHSSAVSGLGKAISNPRQISRHPSSSSSSEDDDLDQVGGYGLDTRRLSSSINHNNGAPERPDFSSMRLGPLTAAAFDDDAMSDTSDMSSGSNARFTFPNPPHLRSFQTVSGWSGGSVAAPLSTGAGLSKQTLSRQQANPSPSKPPNTNSLCRPPDSQAAARSPSWGDSDSGGGGGSGSGGEYSGFREPVRRPVSRTTNLRPRPKMLMRVLNQLSEESTPFVSELRSEAAVTKSFKDDVESDCLNRTLLEQFDRANKNEQHAQTSPKEEHEISMNDSKYPEFGDHQIIDYDDRQSIMDQLRAKNNDNNYNPNHSSSSSHNSNSDYRHSLSQSPVSGSEFSPFHHAAASIPQHPQPLAATQPPPPPPPPQVERQPLKRKPGRDVQVDEQSLKRRAVSPGLQPQNSPIGSPRASFAAARRSTGGGIKYISDAHNDFMNMSLS